MRRKGLIVLGVLVFALIALQSCKSSPEKSLLGTYFHAVSLKDTATMSSMAVEPVAIDAQSWQITSVSEEKIDPVNLGEMSKTELELKKKLEDHVGPVMDAEDELYSAQEELKAARTAGARSAAKKKVDEAQVKFDKERDLHRELQRSYNEAKAAAQKEKDIALFSLGADEIPNIMDLAGTIQSKQVEVNVVGKAGQPKSYRFSLRRYELKDEAANVTHRGRWIIVKSEPLT